MDYKTCKEVSDIHPDHPHPSSLSRQCKAGKIPGAVRIGNLWLIPEETIPKIRIETNRIAYNLRGKQTSKKGA